MSNPASVPTSRTYVHDRCGNATVVSGNDFESLANPFAFCSGTMCVACNKAFPLKQFVWADTGETITARRSRLRGATSPAQKLFSMLVGPLIFGLIGAGIGYLIKPARPSYMAGGAVGGIALFIGILPMFTKALFKIDYRAIE